MSIDQKFSRLLAIVQELRTRCAWDREQTLHTVAKGMVEEAYEVLDAAERESCSELAAEFGDVLVQVLFGAVLLAEQNSGDIGSILEGAATKLVRRHPHVYGDATAKSADDALASWEKIKREERATSGSESALDGVARTLPALMLAEKIGKRARAAGVDWASVSDVIRKVREELDEVESALAAGLEDEAAAEFGDALLALANAPRFVGAEAEAVLRAATAKFIGRFRRLEEIARHRLLNLSDLDERQIDDLWREAKQAESGKKD
jgi:ATP diphosphatase